MTLDSLLHAVAVWRSTHIRLAFSGRRVSYLVPTTNPLMPTLSALQVPRITTTLGMPGFRSLRCASHHDIVLLACATPPAKDRGCRLRPQKSGYDLGVAEDQAAHSHVRELSRGVPQGGITERNMSACATRPERCLNFACVPDRMRSTFSTPSRELGYLIVATTTTTMTSSPTVSTLAGVRPMQNTASSSRGMRHQFAVTFAVLGNC